MPGRTQLPGRGFGKSGYCKLCSWEHEPELNRLIKGGQNAAKCQDWALDKFSFKFNRQTFYTHKKDHLNGGAAVENKALIPSSSGGPITQIKRTSNREFLETIRDIGYTKAELDPDSVTMEQALKAASILEASGKKQTDITIVFAQAVTGHSPDVIVEGTAREVAEPSVE